ncbi:MAG: gliding motility protein GldL [Chitinophagales bacterium]
MAKKKSMFHTKGGKTILNYAYSFGAALVILGALFKILHLPGANIMLMVGMGAEVLIFIISGFEPQEETHDEYEWERVYPELANEYAGEGSGGAGASSITQKLDNMLEEANIEKDMIARLGTNLGKLSDNVSNMADVSEAVGATSDYAQNARAAANALGEVKDAYAAALSSAQGLSTTLESMSEISASTAQVKSEMEALTSNLASMNQVYGNMLTAMRPS